MDILLFELFKQLQIIYVLWIISSVECLHMEYCSWCLLAFII